MFYGSVLYMPTLTEHPRHRLDRLQRQGLSASCKLKLKERGPAGSGLKSPLYNLNYYYWFFTAGCPYFLQMQFCFILQTSKRTRTDGAAAECAAAHLLPATFKTDSSPSPRQSRSPGGAGGKPAFRVPFLQPPQHTSPQGGLHKLFPSALPPFPNSVFYCPKQMFTFSCF